MKILKTISNPENKTKAIALAKLFSVTATAQILIQIIGLVCGVLIIRNFTVQEYSWYTISNTVLGAMTSLADGGIVAGVMAEGGKVWKDKYKLGSVVLTGLKLRKKFGAISVFCCGIVLVYLLTKNNAPMLYSSLILLCLIPTFYANLVDSILEVPPKLTQNLNALQGNQLKANIGRLILTICSVAFLPFTGIALLAAGIPRIIANIKLRRIAESSANMDAEKDMQVEKSIVSFVKSVMPLTIYSIFSGQISIWLLSFFSNSSNISNAGALMRIGAMYALIGLIIKMMIIPRFARQNSDKLKENIIYFTIGFICFTCFVMIFTYLFSDYLLKILGSNYSNLKIELLIVVGISLTTVFYNSLYSINLSRGWKANPYYIIGFSVLVLCISALILDATTLKGVLLLNFWVSFALCMLHLMYSMYKLKKLNNV